jgi:hypothetical protein
VSDAVRWEEGQLDYYGANRIGKDTRQLDCCSLSCYHVSIGTWLYPKGLRWHLAEVAGKAMA